MPSTAKILETLHRLDSGKDYNISQDLDQNFQIKNTRQPIRYADLLNFYRNDKIKFESHVKPPCAPHQSRRDLIGLFQNKSLNDKLLRLFEFPGLAKHCTWNSLTIFYELSNLVPRELEQKLNHLAVFWEKLSLLAECPEDIYCDKDTPSKISGLWPLKCESDMEKLHTLEKSRLFFALVTNSDIRRNIVNRIATLDYRVPTFPIVISESSALLQLALLLRKRLDAIGERSGLEHSTLIWKGRCANKHQYLQCFLAAARAQCNESHGKMINDLRCIFETPEPESPSPINAAALQETSEFRRVSAYPHGIWSSVPTLPLFFDKKMLGIGPITCATQRELPMILLVQDFFHSFFMVNWGKPTNASWPNKKVVQYIPFKLDVSPKESSSDAEQFLWGVLQDDAIDTTEPRWHLNSLWTHTGDVRRQGELAVARPPVRSVYIGVAGKGESITRSSVRTHEVQRNHQRTTSTTNDEFHGSECTVSSAYEECDKAEQEETSGSLFGNVGTKVDVSAYRSIVEARMYDMKDWASSAETLQDVNDIQSHEQGDVLSENDSECPFDDSTLGEEEVDGSVEAQQRRLHLLVALVNNGKKKYAMKSG